MNNFELDEQAKILSDTLTNYALARRVIELEDKYKIIEDSLEEVTYNYDLLVNALEFIDIDADYAITVYEARGVYE